MKTSVIEQAIADDKETGLKEREPRFGRLAITMIVAFVVVLPAFIFARELSYYAYPPSNYEPESAIAGIRSSPMMSIALAYLCAVIALLVSHQAGCFVKTISPSRRVLFGIGFVLGPPLLMVSAAVGTALIFDRAIKGSVAAGIEFAVWTMIWLVPWFAYIYAIRLLMSLASRRVASLVIYLFGIVLMVAMVYPLALWLGETDGGGQGIVAMMAAMALSILISAGLADLVLKTREAGPQMERKDAEVTT